MKALQLGISAAVSCGLLSYTTSALAHVSVSGPGFAGQRQILTFNVGHGCAGDDTVAVEIRLPEQVNAVRPVRGALGEGEVMTSSAGIPLAVTFSKQNARAMDDQYYRVALQITVPDTPFTTLYFPAIQTCRSAVGDETTHEWIGLPGDPEDPAPALTIMPERRPGWNKVVPDQTLTDLSLFDDAQIVWQGNAAYSGSETTMELIMNTADVGVLSEISAGMDVWVKY